MDSIARRAVHGLGSGMDHAAHPVFGTPHAFTTTGPRLDCRCAPAPSAARASDSPSARPARRTTATLIRPGARPLVPPGLFRCLRKQFVQQRFADGGTVHLGLGVAQRAHRSLPLRALVLVSVRFEVDRREILERQGGQRLRGDRPVRMQVHKPRRHLVPIGQRLELDAHPEQGAHRIDVLRGRQPARYADELDPLCLQQLFEVLRLWIPVALEHVGFQGRHMPLDQLQRAEPVGQPPDAIVITGMQ